MLQMFFCIRFQTQLQRTKPELIATLEHTVSEAIKTAGGEVMWEGHRISALFKEDSPGFWLDILVMLETILAILEKVSPELYGYTVILGQDLSGEMDSYLLNAMPANSPGTEIWCSPPVQKVLTPYMVFDAPLNGTDSLEEGYAQVNHIRTFSDTNGERTYPLQKKIEAGLKEGSARNVLLTGPEYMGKGDGLYRFCLSKFKNPLVIRFGLGGTGLCCFSDAVNSGIRSWLSNHIEDPILEELDWLGALLFRERFQHEYPNYIIQKGRRFLNLLSDVYIKAAEADGGTPVFILENLQAVDAVVGNLFIDLYQSFPHKKALRVYGTWSLGTQDDYHAIKLWEPIFPRILSLEPELIPEGISSGINSGIPVPLLSEMPLDLWELAYAMGLFLHYFPASLLMSLFEEAGKNAPVIRRAFSLLSYFGIIDFIDEPRMRMRDLIKKAETILGERKNPICLLVRKRLLDWVQAEKLRPSFTMLKALFNLGWEGTDAFILRALQMDIIHETFGEIEKALEDGSFDRIAGKARAPILRPLYKTSKVLIYGGEKEIREAFFEPDPEEVSIPEYETQIQLNRANYLLSVKDLPAAVTMVKKSIILIQGQRDQLGLAQAYRLFTLASFSSQRMSDAVDYSFFAIENAKRNQDSRELALIYFYAAEVQFLIGNIFKAEFFVREAEEAALNAGRLEWVERIRFFAGRLRFETGLYQEALTIFESIQNNLSGYKRAAAGEALAVWIYRTNMYLQNYAAEKPEILLGEGLFFQLEAAYLIGDYERAVKYSELLLDVLEDQKFLFTEQPDWDGAYAQGELFMIPKSEFFSRIGSVFRALALCRLKPAGEENKQEAIRIIRRVIQDERLFSTDPNDAFYFYAYYLILKESGAAEIDMNTAISIAFKRLQRRANQIDNIETKRSFLSLHYWNNALYLAAREHKLI
ncbi:MAG: hypothetical protein LBC60_13345 [Spirochaetaceae bacterium]|jgi:tetratricopeptide (TPR) repeat protein|nr:hypothetical protein [Spirochaetaceae bacterium]